VDALIASLQEDDSGLRFCAAGALGRIADERAFEPLLPLLQDPEIYPRAYAAEALGSLGDPRAFDVLIRILQSDEDSWIIWLAPDQQAEAIIPPAGHL
jgi:HEAT repeat protein